MPGIEKSLTALSSKLGGSIPKSLSETLARLSGLAVATSFQEFDAAVRESYASRDDFAVAFDQYVKGRQLRERAFDLSQAKDYLTGACDIDSLCRFSAGFGAEFLCIRCTTQRSGHHPRAPGELRQVEGQLRSCLPKGAQGNHQSTHRRAEHTFFRNAKRTGRRSSGQSCAESTFNSASLSRNLLLSGGGMKIES